MHEYDIALKSILMRLNGSVLAQLTGIAVERWHNVELPAVQNRRVDLLGQAADGRLLHIELQSTNDNDMALRMLEYATAIHREFRRFPHQIVLYVGNAPLQMKARIEGPTLTFHCRIADIRELDSEPLLASNSLEDNVIAILTRLGDKRAAVRSILANIAEQDPARRASAIEQLMILASLRKLGPTIEREIEQMPILDDIMDDEVLGRERKRGIALGLEKGREEGERKLVLRQIEARFGSIPLTTRQRIDAMSASELEEIGIRLMNVRTLEELLG
jgi:predicted transposase/invertase (TIGR01784 family)